MQHPAKLMCTQVVMQTDSAKNCPHSHWSQLPSPHLPQLVNEPTMGTHRGRSLWILTVWWWLQSLSAAGRWSDLPSQWSTPPHSLESKPSGSTPLPLQWGNKKQEVKHGYGSVCFLQPTCWQSTVWIKCLVKPLPSCVFHLFLHLLQWKSSSSSISFIPLIVFWSEFQVRSACQLSQTEQPHANAASLFKKLRSSTTPNPSPKTQPPWTKHTGINPPNRIKRWLLSMTTNYFHNQMIPCRRYLSCFSTHPFVRASKHSLQIVWSNFSIGLEESGPRHCLGTMERSWGICWSVVLLAKLISFSQRSWIHRHMNV